MEKNDNTNNISYKGRGQNVTYKVKNYRRMGSFLRKHLPQPALIKWTIIENVILKKFNEQHR